MEISVKVPSLTQSPVSKFPREFDLFRRVPPTNASNPLPPIVDCWLARAVNGLSNGKARR
jgi:hypothetical protein